MEMNYTKRLVDMVAKSILEAFENVTIEDVNMYILGYNKAIDDFTKAIKEKWSCCGYVEELKETEFDSLAEQLKNKPFTP